MEIKQDHVDIKVDYFDLDEKYKLEQYPNRKDIQAIVGSTLSVSTSEFLTYYLYGRKESRVAGWMSFHEISDKIDRAIIDLKDFIVFNGHSLNVNPMVQNLSLSIRERLGEAIGLSVVNKLHGLTEADWDRIPEKRGRGARKVFDYQKYLKAASQSFVVQLEAKGSLVSDTTITCSVTKEQKRKIKKKKLAIKEYDKYEHPADIRYGTVGTIDNKKASYLRCWLVDPPAEKMPKELSIMRLLARLGFINDWINVLSPKSYLSIILNNRLTALQNLKDPFELDNIPLTGRRGEPLESLAEIGGAATGWYSTKSIVIGESAGGVVNQRMNRLLFLGIQQRLLNVAERQDFNEIVSWSDEGRSIRRDILCKVPSGQFSRRFNLSGSFAETVRVRPGYVEFQASGMVHFAPSGVVFCSITME